MLCRLALSALLCLPLFALAAEPLTPDKIKKMAGEAMTKAGLKDAQIVETDNLIVATALPEAKAKALAESLQKTYALAVKTLKFDDEATTKGHLIIYTFADVDQFRQFQHSVLKVRPEDDEYAIHDVKKDPPFIAVSTRRGDRNPNFEILAGNEISRALLAKKGGNARLTEWMKDGFAKAVQWHLNPASIGTDRSTVARIAPRVGKTAKVTPVVDKAWSGAGKEKDAVAASLMDFLTFGAGADKLSNIFNGLIPGDGVKDPIFMDALKASEWMLEDLDRAWRDWVAKGSPVEVSKGK